MLPNCLQIIEYRHVLIALDTISILCNRIVILYNCLGVYLLTLDSSIDFIALTVPPGSFNIKETCDEVRLTRN